MKVAGRWTDAYRAIDQFGQVVDVLACDHRDLAAARRFCYRNAGQCSGLQTGGEGPRGRALSARACSRPGLAGTGLLLDVLPQNDDRGAADGAGEVGA